MAEHIDSVASSAIPSVSKDEFYRMARSGDLVFCSGKERISKVIESETRSVFSHVMQLWLPTDAKVWLTLESTIGRGVHVGLFSGYTDKYDGDLVLARRPELGAGAIATIRNKMLRVIGDAYDWKQEVTIAGHKICKEIPIEIPRNEYFCSGYQYYGSLAVSPPLQRPSVNFPTPEDNWTDPSVVPVCALLTR
jgi:hypothetical protein